ncbi:MAG TPA: 2,3-bisphosphoglycerate-independent phosphoglycerate mutase [Solirubrobacterales bacterium]|nr:2,3-bisphosphoglycerate-independent phosphoglycerate mutase [Solirubrobacterales bacterium]
MKPAPAVALVILDGWGIAPAGPGNAISLADTPVFDELWAGYPHTQLEACGAAVGLPPGQMGNSEVGHLNLGAGTVVKQDLVRIDEAIADGSFFDNPTAKAACAAARESGGALHLIGLVSGGGVHSSLEHLHACIELGARERVPAIVLHAFTDGRDTLPTSSPGYLAQAEGWLAAAQSAGVPARVGTVMGRYWGMDRDRRWDRTKRGYDALVHSEGLHADTAEAAVKMAYGRDETDEFIQPTIVGDAAPIRAGDSVLTFNFRPDRMRQLVRALGEPDFSELDRRGFPRIALATMTRYQEDWDYPVVFEEARPEITIAQVLADRGDRQLHAAETEKYPHVTYFFNGGEEDPYPGEHRVLVPSPRDVPTYDQKPEMSAPEAAAEFTRRWRAAVADGAPYKFGIINFANPDMVGHTGSIPAAVRAVETVDRCLGEVLEAVFGSGGAAIVTADHGNADEMLTPDGGPQTAHSLNPVPFIVTMGDAALAEGGVLANVAPTALAMLGIPQPAAMHSPPLLTTQ